MHDILLTHSEKTMKISFLLQNHTDLIEQLGSDCATKSARHVYKKLQFDFDSLNSISKKNKEKLIENYSFDLPMIKEIHESSDETVKFLFEFSDKKTAETVLIPFYKRYTACLSTQVGCAMGCTFCFTGTQGLKRNLAAEEIIGQYLVAWNWLKINKPERSISPNIVYMGQGEPLHNFENVKKATELFLEKKHIGLGPRQMTLSTAGYLPGLKRFHEFPQINLALSLHSTNEVARSELIPLNKSYNLNDLFEVLDKLELKKRQFITFEYLMIKNLNMFEEDVHGLVKNLSSRRAIINLIPFNPFPGSKYLRPTLSEIDTFRNSLVEKGLHVMIRTTKGDSILAACGQLTSK
jgi:23S rRNA (adenine2503-C2)-methyltransferase